VTTIKKLTLEESSRSSTSLNATWFNLPVFYAVHSLFTLIFLVHNFGLYSHFVFPAPENNSWAPSLFINAKYLNRF